MTDQFNKLADALESYTGDGHGYQVDDAVLREASALLRAAAGVDVAGLMALAQDFGSARWAEGFDEKNKPHGQPARHKKEAVKQLTALESALRLLLAQRVPPEILAISERLHTQDNRITQDPLFAVQQKRRIYGVEDGYRDGVVWIDDEGNESPDGGPFKRGSRKVGYIDIWEFVTGCFTEQGCKDFIACNGHNLNEPRIYAYGSYRNAEFIALRKWLMSLAAAPQAKEQTA